MKEQDKSLEKQINRQPSRKIIQNNNSEDDPGSQKKNGDDARNVYQRPCRNSEQLEMNNALGGINIRIIKAGWISDLEDRMVEIVLSQNTRMKNE